MPTALFLTDGTVDAGMHTTFHTRTHLRVIQMRKFVKHSALRLSLAQLHSACHRPALGGAAVPGAAAAARGAVPAG